MSNKIKTGISLSEYIKGVIDETVKSAMYQRTVKEKALQRALTEEDEDEEKDDEESSDEDTDEEEDSSEDDTSEEGESEESDDDEGSDDDDSPKEKKPSKITTPDDSAALKKGDIKPEDIIEKLNSIRSGKSFRDDTIKKNMTDYIEGLDKAERTALFAFLLAISQIVTAEMQATQVIDPSEDPSAVKMKKGAGEKQTKHIKPNVIKATPPKKEKKASGEDTTGPVPITPKK